MPNGRLTHVALLLCHWNRRWNKAHVFMFY